MFALTLRRSLRPLIAFAPIWPVAGTAPFESTGPHRKASDLRIQWGSKRLPPIRGENTPRNLEEFERLVKDGKATPDTATAFLQRSQTSLERLPLDERKKKAAAAGGGRILQWLWTQRDDSTREQDLPRDLVQPLCWHLEAEGLEDYVWKWLDILEDSMATASSKHDNRHQMQWTGRLLASLIVAKIEWHPKKNPEPGLEVLMHAIARYPRSRGNRGLRWATAFTGVASVLQRDDTVPCSEHMFEQFVDILADMDTSSSPPHRRERLAFTLLYHPTKPIVEPVLTLWRERKARPTEYPKILDASTRRARVTFLLRTAYILRYAKRVEDATWLEKVVQDDFPELWGQRVSCKRGSDLDPKLNMVRQRFVAADSEILEAWDLGFESRKR